MAERLSVTYKKLKSLKKVFQEENSNISKVAISLIDEAFFCGDTLRKLKEEVNKGEVITEMQQGDYSIMRENPALKSYNTTIKNYQALLKQITELLPIELEEKQKKYEQEDDFDEFSDEV